MKRSSQTEKKVFSSANGFEKRPAAKKNFYCIDHSRITFVRKETRLEPSRKHAYLHHDIRSFVQSVACRACSQGFIPADSETAVYAVDNGRTDFRQDI